MDNKYRELLRIARSGEGILHPLYQASWCYKPLKLEEKKVSIGQKKPVVASKKLNSVSEVDEEKSDVTEKTVMLDSLNVFGQEKLENSESFKFKGGELAKKEDISKSKASLNVEINTIEDLILEIQNTRGDSFNTNKITKLMSTNKKIKVMFITDDSVEEQIDCPEHLNELGQFFDFDVSTLFYNMINAMKLTVTDYCISSIMFNDRDNLKSLLGEIYLLKPELIITLGATSSHKILNSKERLKDSHGQISKVEFENNKEETFQTHVMPLFSPKLLQTAPNMKKTAWKDMQKAMEFLEINCDIMS